MSLVPAKAGPTVNAVTAPFWEGLADGQLLLQHCGRCGRSQHYPRVLCRTCWSSDLSWTEATGAGTVWTWTVVHRPGHPAWEAEAPYAVVVVELAEGPRLVTGYDGDLASLRVGLPVHVDPVSRGEYSVAVARPVAPPQGDLT